MIDESGNGSGSFGRQGFGWILYVGCVYGLMLKLVSVGD